MTTDAVPVGQPAHGDRPLQTAKGNLPDASLIVQRELSYLARQVVCISDESIALYILQVAWGKAIYRNDEYD